MEMQSTGRRRDGETLAKGLGWFSIGLGLAEVAAPRALSRLIGVESDTRTHVTMRAFGARELAAGLGILSMPRRPMPVWSRVAGDLIDLAMLGWAFSAKRTKTERLVGAIVAVLGVTALDVIAGRKLQQRAAGRREPLTGTITVNRPVSEVYAMWRDLEQLPTFMAHLRSVRDLGNGRSHWVAELPTGGAVEWDAEIVDERPNQALAWRSVEGSRVQHHGVVTFSPTPDGRGTELRVEMKFGLPLAELIARSEIKGDLRRFKQVIETGEVVHSDASIHKGTHAAQPSAQKGLLP